MDREIEGPAEFLEWDSGFFGIRIARALGSRLESESLHSLLKWCEENRIECLYFIADAADRDTVRLAEENRFRFVDVRLTYERILQERLVSGERAEGLRIRPSIPADIPSLSEIAAASHHDTRFYFDRDFPDEACDRLYRTWIEKSCSGHADAVLVAELDRTPVGYLTCHLESSPSGRIGLVAVAAEARGKRVGTELVSESFRWFAERGVERVTVLTQGRNTSSQRLYQKCGFRTRSLQLCYHWWFGR